MCCMVVVGVLYGCGGCVVRLWVVCSMVVVGVWYGCGGCTLIWWVLVWYVVHELVCVGLVHEVVCVGLVYGAGLYDGLMIIVVEWREARVVLCRRSLGLIKRFF